MSRIKTLAALALVVFSNACGPVPINDYVSPTKVVSTAPAAVQILASTRPDQQLAVSAIVTTSTGQAVSGVTVSFAATSGSITPSVATTDSDGTARAVASQQFQNTITATAANLTQSFVIKGPAIDPLTVFISAASTVYEDDPVEINASIYSAAGVTTRVVRWDFGDGASSSANALSQNHRYEREGNYTVTLEAADSLGRTATGTRRIAVREPPAPVTSGAPGPAQGVSVSISCTIVTPIRRTCTATPMYNGAAIAGALVAGMTLSWGDGSSEAVTTGTAVSHNYAVGTTGNKVIRVVGSLTTGETFDSQITIGVG